MINTDIKWGKKYSSLSSVKRKQYLTLHLRDSGSVHSVMSDYLFIIYFGQYVQEVYS